MAVTTPNLERFGDLRRGLGLHLKLAFAGAVTVLACIVVLSGLLISRQSTLLDAEIQRSSEGRRRALAQRGQLLAENLAAAMETAIADYNFGFIMDTVQKRRERVEPEAVDGESPKERDVTDDLKYSFIVNADGYFIAHTDTKKVGVYSGTEGLEDGPRELAGEYGRVIEIPRALTVGGRPWGWFVLGLDLEPLDQLSRHARERKERVLARSASVGVLIALAVAMLGLGLSMWASRRLLRPVVQLAEDAAAIAEGHLDHEIGAIRSSDEIGVLARQFEAMRRSIRSYVSELVVAKQVAEDSMRQEKRLRAEIEQHSLLLESKVEERTAELKAINERLKEYDRLKSEFLSNVSHELRSPLAAISSAAKIINRYGAGKVENNKRFSNVIIEETDRLTRLINDLLDLSKIEAGKSEWHIETIERPVDLLEHVVTAFRPLFEESNVELLLEVDGSLPEIRGDRDRLIQVLTNLCSNARKFTPAGGRVVVSGRAGEREGQRLLEIHVTDTGPGIPLEEREEVFERFHQVRKEHKPTGTGLGLSICREVVHYHGGSIWAEEPDGGGTRMVILLPVFQVETRAVPPSADASAA